MEMVLKLIAFGMNDYFRDGMNIFDCVIVIISITDWVLSNISIQVNGGSLAGIKALRTLRLFRMFKLARSWVKFRELLAAIAATLLAISNFVVLLLLFMIVVALLGMELFAYRVRIDGKYPRENFNTFYDSMITIFVLLTNENWNGITYQYLLYNNL
jgi:voltage-dependent calcium channel L type alpha-1D